MSNNNSVAGNNKKKKSSFREYAEAVITAILIALLIRSFGIEAFKIPSSSMIPTLMIGDHIFVNKFIYGLRIPLTKIRFFEFRKPERGDVIVFIYPKDESKDFIKRVLGLPGDSIRIENENVFVNGKEIPIKEISVFPNKSEDKLMISDSESHKTLPYFRQWRRFDFFDTDIGKEDVIIQYEKNIYHRSGEFNVPENHLFVMGDNRDNSSDSREWGYVPLENVKGKAMFVWLSLNKEKGGIRFKRIGEWID
jgi:signal peptidase I